MEHLVAMCSVMAWESMPAVIQNCFAKCGCGTLSAVNTEEIGENGQVGGTGRSHGLS